MTEPLDAATEIAAWLAATDIDLLELNGPEGHLRLRREGGSVRAETLTAIPQCLTVTADHPGEFLHSHPLRNAALIEAGENVRAGHILGLLRIGPLLLPVRAPQAGVVIGMWTAHQTSVGYGVNLVELCTSEGAAR